MKEICILTWNTQLYEQGNIIEGHIKEIDMCNFVSITEFIKEHLKKDNSIAFLQEIPYCCNITWKEHPLYTKFRELFAQYEYDIKFNITSSKQIMMNVVISKPNTLILDPSSWNDNRTISVQYEEMKMMGIHAKNGKNNKNYLIELSNHTAHVILGDFNSGNYYKSENRLAFNNLFKQHTCICNENTTIYGTPIDHIFVDNNILPKCTKPIIHSKIKYSDHFPITFKISI